MVDCELAKKIAGECALKHKWLGWVLGVLIVIGLSGVGASYSAFSIANAESNRITALETAVSQADKSRVEREATLQKSFDDLRADIKELRTLIIRQQKP